MIIRLISAAIGLPILIFAVWYGPPEQPLYWFSAFIFIVAILATIETWRLVRRYTTVFHIGFSIIFTAFMLVGANSMAMELVAGVEDRPDIDTGFATSLYNIYDGFTRFFNQYLLAIAACAMTAILLRKRNAFEDEGADEKKGYNPFAEYERMRTEFPMTTTLAVSFYAAGFVYYAPLLRNLEQGREWIFFMLAVVFATDTCAYFVGRAIGKTPLAPSISPNKTSEGAIAGMAGAIFACLIANTLLGLNAIIWQALLLGVIIGALAQSGDLVESALKRKAGVKDSGFLIPGHGGILDRMDSIMLGVPATYYFVIWIVQ